MRRLLDRYYGSLRRIKANYVLLNLLSRKRLGHAERMFRKYGIRRDPALPFHSGMIRDTDGGTPWLDAPNGQDLLEQDLRFQVLPAELQGSLRSWPGQGYAILRKVFSLEEVNEVNAEVDRLLKEGSVDYNFTGRKIMFAYRQSEAIQRMASSPEILQVLELLLGRPMNVFQTINFLTG
ncbi:MAG: hypothetical protein KDB88_07535, partial [Flavobacteriales bacterium]|nr:hypothetical protein [Flavobacteriales bacterium]